MPDEELEEILIAVEMPRSGLTYIGIGNSRMLRGFEGELKDYILVETKLLTSDSKGFKFAAEHKYERVEKSPSVRLGQGLMSDSAKHDLGEYIQD